MLQFYPKELQKEWINKEWINKEWINKEVTVDSFKEFFYSILIEINSKIDNAFSTGEITSLETLFLETIEHLAENLNKEFQLNSKKITKLSSKHVEYFLEHFENTLPEKGKTEEENEILQAIGSFWAVYNKS